MPTTLLFDPLLLCSTIVRVITEVRKLQTVPNLRLPLHGRDLLQGHFPTFWSPGLESVLKLSFNTHLVIVMTTYRSGPSRRLLGRYINRSAGDLPSTDEPINLSSEFVDIVRRAHEQDLEEKVSVKHE